MACDNCVYKFGKCRICGEPEGKLLRQGAITYPGGSPCPKSEGGMGKCLFKFSRCRLCGRSEYGGDYTLTPNPNKVKKSYRVKCPPCVFDFGKCRGCGKPEGKLAKPGSFANPGGSVCPKNQLVVNANLNLLKK